MEETETQIEVRTLIGESTTVSISPNKSIRDLKLILKHRFPSISSDFHLFLRGMKLGLQSQLGSHSINSGDFIALIPFVKKGKPQTLQDQDLEQAAETCHPSVPSNLAESTWHAMVEDLSFLNKTSDSEKQPGCLPGLSDAKNAGHSVYENGFRSDASTKRRRMSNFDGEAGLSEALISNILQSSGKHILDEDFCRKLLNVLESVHCLSDVKSGNCVLLSKADIQESAHSSCSCICPPWLKIVMKAFTFLNLLAGVLQMHHETVTFERVKDSLDKLRELGLCANVEVLRRLSMLCPKVVQFVEQEPEGKLSHNVIVVYNFSRERRDEHRAREMSMMKIVRSIKTREALFKTTLEEAFSLLMLEGKHGCKNVISLDELIMNMKKADHSSRRYRPKQARSSSFKSKSRSGQTKCHGTHPLSPFSMLEHLREHIGSNGQIVHVEEIRARVANFTEIPEDFSDSAKLALSSLGITKLYSHQAESIKASLCSRNVVVATMTSSGKSLCYNLPVLEALSQDLLSCALYLFPTKALAQDQLRALLAMTENFEHLNVGVYDGDTSQAKRNWLRANGRLLITNPDMLHMSILPFHGQFQRILLNLKFVIIDEAHAYKGAFGCHTALVLRRLRRLCSHVYGSDPSFVFSTATSANPREHVKELANLSTVELIDKDGSPSGPKRFILWNPPLCPRSVPQAGENDETIFTRRSSPMMEVSCLLAEMVQHGLRSIAFCKTRKLCELVLSYTREILQETAPHLVNSICAYRAGYVAEDRRRIESDFFSGKLCGIAATNALELGIDVGHIDVTLHLGFPGSVSSLWQQAGRAGRRGRPSLAVYVAFEGPLDQYFMKYPQKLFRRPIECCHVDAKNPKVLEQHLVCAALEHPLSVLYDEKYFGSGLKSAIASLQRSGYLCCDPSRSSDARIWSYIGQEKSPSHAVSIRAIESEKYQVIDRQTNELLEEIEESKAFFQVYDGAVYMNQGQTYLVEELNLSTKTAVCRKADLKYYTQTRDYTDIDVIGGHLAYPARASKNLTCRTTAQTTSCKVTTTWFGFHCKERGSNRILDTMDLMLPKYSYDSQAVWIRVPTSVKTAVERENFSFRAGLHAASHAVLNVVPLFIISDSSDLAPECANPHETRYVPERILIYDGRPGGTGLSIRIQPMFNDLLAAALDMLTSCHCSVETGCLNCVHSLACQEYNELVHKDAAIMIIKGVLEAEKSYFQEQTGHPQTL